MSASLVFETPSAGLVAFAAVGPIAAFVLADSRLRAARTLLRLPRRPRRSRHWRLALVVSVPLMIAVAIAQPVVRRHGSVPLRADAGIFVVVDTSNSMAAAASARAPSRLAQAKRIALAVGAQLPGIPLGVATFTDRVLPDAFPSTDRAIFDSTVESLSVDDPPPRETARVATDFSALAAIQQADFFSPAQRHRAVLVITDGESAAFDAGATAHALAATPAAQLVIVRVGGARDRLHGAGGRAAGGYRADLAGARRAVAQLAAATGGTSSSGDATKVAATLRNEIGSGAATEVASAPETFALGPLIALASLVPLILVLMNPEALLRLKRRLP
jgi:von Willebrand factor type A domain